MSARRGKTLIELLAVISVLTVVMTLGARLMVLLMRASGNSTQSLISTTTRFRLSREFTRDVHQAIDVTLENSDNLSQNRMLLKLPQAGEVAYVLEGEQVQRTLRHGKKRVRSEKFRLSGSGNRFEWNADERLVSFVHWRNATKTTAKTMTPPPNKEMRVEAVLGRDHRFTAGRE